MIATIARASFSTSLARYARSWGLWLLLLTGPVGARFMVARDDGSGVQIAIGHHLPVMTSAMLGVSQQKTIARLTAEPAFRDMQVFRIDYDTQNPLWQKFRATMQSTVIAFHGKRETARIAHETDDAKVSAVIRSAIS